MTLTDIASIANIVGAVALVVSAVAVLHELRHNNRLSKANNTGALVSTSAPFAFGLIQDRNMAEFYVRGACGYEDMDEVDQYRYKNMLWWWLVYHENIFYQRHHRLLDEHTYKAWDNELRVFVKRQNLKAHWENMAELFQEEFARHVFRIIDETPTTKLKADI